MPWPGITDYSEAIQNPGLCFKGTDLEAGTVAANQRGMPLVFSGNFACVYQVSAGGSKYAVRCFTREVKDQQTRYNQLSEYLINVLPPSFVHFEYVEHGINLKGTWYPIVRMQWVEGESLSSFVGSNVNDTAALRRVAAQWRGGPAASLRGLGIAHNDLQHGNVMVQADGRIRLVDYDGMFLPQFRGERSPELGHKNFQHPLRTAEDYDAYVDNFPSLVVYASLIALASDPGLWDFYNDDNLVFTRNDYADPGQSPLFDRLKKSPDRTVAKLAERLEECCALPVDDVPDLEAILRDIPPSPAPSSAPSAPAPSAPSAASSPPAAAPPASGQTYRQTLAGQPAAPAQPTASTTPAAPAQPTASPTPAAPAQPTASTTPAAPAQTKRCRACLRDNRSHAAMCAYCGAWLIKPSNPLPGLAPKPSGPINRLSGLDPWLRMLLAGGVIMFFAWQYLVLSSLMILAGLIAAGVFLWKKNPIFLALGIILSVAGIVLIVAGSGVWTWLFIPGAGLGAVGAAIGIVKVEGAARKAAVAVVLAAVILVTLQVTTGLISNLIATLVPGLAST